MKMIRGMIAALSLSLACLATQSSAGFQSIGETYWTNTGQTFTGVSVPAASTIYSRVQAESFGIGYVQSIVIVAGPITGLVHQLSAFATPYNPNQSDERFAFNQPASFYAVYHIVSLGSGTGSARTLTTLSW